MERNHAYQTFDPMYATDYTVLNILTKSTLILATLIEKEHKMNIDNVRPCTTLEIVKRLELILEFYKTNHPNHEYNLRPCD